MVTMLQKMKEAPQPLAISIVQPILNGMIEFLTPNVICDTKPSGFKVTREWTRQFMKHYMNWTFRASIITTNKFPTNWQEKCKFMVLPSQCLQHSPFTCCQ